MDQLCTNVPGNHIMSHLFFFMKLLDGKEYKICARMDSGLTRLFIIFQDLFVAEGEGLPRSLVEEEAKFYRQILSLFSLQVDDSHFRIATNSKIFTFPDFLFLFLKYGAD